MSNSSNTNLIVCCNILNRVETLLQRNNRVQLSKENLNSISDYLTKVIKHYTVNDYMFSNQIVVFGKSIESIDDLIKEEKFDAASMEVKDYLVEKLYDAINEFKVNVGKYLTNNDFDYSPAMDSVLKNIIDLCIANNYYFGY